MALISQGLLSRDRQGAVFVSQESPKWLSTLLRQPRSRTPKLATRCELSPLTCEPAPDGSRHRLHGSPHACCQASAPQLLGELPHWLRNLLGRCIWPQFRARTCTARSISALHPRQIPDRCKRLRGRRHFAQAGMAMGVWILVSWAWPAQRRGRRSGLHKPTAALPSSASHSRESPGRPDGDTSHSKEWVNLFLCFR